VSGPNAVRAHAIASHAVLGDGRSAALVAADGTIDWLCWPHFDSPAVLAAILDPERGGALRVAPAAAARASRRYLDGTHVLETRFTTASGVLRLTDWMALPAERGRGFAPGHELLRLAACEEGEVEVEIAADLRPGFGAAPARLRQAGPLGIRLECRRELYTLRATVPLAVGTDGAARGRARLRAGDELQVSLAHDGDAPAAAPAMGARVHRELRHAVATWRRWAAAIPDDVPYREAVVRSALVLKLLAYAPSGAIVAAPTTSLPERPGGDLNWDYRYCWPRDASLTVSSLRALGRHDEATRFVAWLLHTTRLTRPRIRVLYDVYGRPPPRERELPHLAGHGGARPVRIGNAAADQHQLDTYGEVIDAVARLVRPDAPLDGETQGMLRDLGKFVCAHWQEPDSGIWEPREAPRLRTHSLVLAWTALDRLLALHAEGALRRLDVRELEQQRGAIRARVEREGWSERLQSYVSELGGDRVDAALLLLPWYGFTDAASPRMRSTWRRIRLRLGAGPGLLYRYEPSLDAGEGAFGACSFWEPAYLARGGGTLDEARRAFEAALSRANDVGLFGEEIDPRTGDALGNFPQAFTHVGLLDAALAIGDRARLEAGASRAAREGEVRA
jgi:GH15 family glucan-1,4-alpha-glucosidase